MSLKTILKNFLNHVDTLEAQRKVGNDLYEVDFQKLKALTEQLKHDKDYSCSEGLKDVNRRKNRYKDILPYDCTRVVLSEYPGVPGSDFINANYIKGASGSLAYIASQGPLPNTLVDFWRMIWECEVQVIVMACNEQESGKYKCECYWPGEDDKKQYGNINVELVKWRQVCPDFLVRTLKACWENEERVLCQFHYTTWPDHGVPNSVQPILELVRLVRDCQASEAVPVLVHCSAGCGRTGTICAIDYVWGLMRMGKLTKSFNLFNVISDMRRQRIAMVQTKEQYVLVHKAVTSLFEQQLRVIDSHTYENLDEDGEPLIFKELQPEEVLYEDILDPEMYEKTYRTPDKLGANDIGLLKAQEYVNRSSSDKESCSTMQHNKSNKSSHPVTNHAISSSCVVIPNEHIVDMSMILPQDYQTTAIAQEILSDPECKDVIPNSRNSTILLKLQREESVKRLISGWNKATQQHHHVDPSINYLDFDTVGKAESSTKDYQNKVDREEHVPQNFVVGVQEQSSIKNDRLEQEKSIPMNGSFSSSGVEQSHRTNNKNFSKCNVKLSQDDLQHSGKLVGKATVIRRPSIAKLKALFEKSATSSSERHSEESSRRRRPLFRSHSHYVGHSRTFSVPDATEPKSEKMSTSVDDAVQNSSQHHSSNNSLNSSSEINNYQQHLIYNVHPTVAYRASSPEKFPSNCTSKSNVNKVEPDIYQCQNSNMFYDTIKSKVDDNREKYSKKLGHVNHEEGSSSQCESYSCDEVVASPKTEELLVNKGSHASDSTAQKIVPVHQRIKQYSIMNEKPPILPVKKRSGSKEVSKSAERHDAKARDKMLINAAKDAVSENDKFKLVTSKSENYLLPSSSAVTAIENSLRLENSNEAFHFDTTKSRTLMYSDLSEASSISTTVSSKCSESKDQSETSGKNTTSKLHHTGSRKENASMYITCSKQPAPEPLYGHCGKINILGSKHMFDPNRSEKDVKYINVNTMSQQNVHQVEEKLKNYPHGAIVDLTSQKSCTDESQGIYERPPTFMSTNQPVKLSQPMESYELKAPEKIKEATVLYKSNQNVYGISGIKQHIMQNIKGSSRSHQDEGNSKNLLLHSPPPKSKRNHTSKNSHRERSNSNECLDEVKHNKLQNTSVCTSSEITKMAEHEKVANKSSINSYEPASRSDPRYFPVTRQTPEDAKYASEKQKTLDSKKCTAEKYENRESFYPTPFMLKDIKANFQYPPHKKVSDVDGNVKKCLPKPYQPYSYQHYELPKPWMVKDNEQIYGVTGSASGHQLLQSKQDVSMSNKELSEKSHFFGNSSTPFMQHSRNASAPASYGSAARENLYGTTKHVSLPQGSYPLGPPKPPRTFNHKYKNFTRESENFSEEKVQPAAGGGRYIVSVASPKHTAERTDCIPVESHKVEYQYYNNIPKRQLPERSHAPYPLPSGQTMSRSYPFPSCDSSAVDKVPEGNTRNNFHTVPSDEHIYHTIPEKPHRGFEPSHSTAKNPSKYSDYENMYDAQREYLDAVSKSCHDASAFSCPQPPAISSPTGIQYSQSDASIYAVLQNPKPVKTSSSSVWKYPPFESGNCKVPQSNGSCSVPKRVYFDTLQRRHKQHVSWEQRRSHDDMDIRPAPSARLKEQIHARRSMVELDNLEISVADENGFHEKDSLVHSILPRKDFTQENNASNGRMVATSQKRPPVELSDSLVSKDTPPRKSQSHSKEPGSFGGTLYKAFGKLTSLTKFNVKEPSNKNTSEDGSTKVAIPKEEKQDPNGSQWTSPNLNSEPSEQWTEV